MTVKTLGFSATLLAVAVLIGSLVFGLRGGDEEVVDGWEAVPIPTQVGVRERIRVEVLNSAGIPGLARAVTESLRADGFDVVYYGNAGSLARDSTTVLDRSGNRSAVEAVSAALRVPRIENAIDTTLYLEATVVLGSDWPELSGRFQAQ
jgi:hypothetical protein